ncbi:hypothetical protein NHQ30_004310 [Ciborinia camelliae]|nr:hypothetical protein NHQ30_004310 [Ciborinia camelliae]
MTKSPMHRDAYSQYSPIGHKFANHFIPEHRSRYWLQGGKSLRGLTYLRLFHTFKKTITCENPYFTTFDQNIRAKADDYCLDNASLTRLEERLSKPPAVQWPWWPIRQHSGSSERCMSSSDAPPSLDDEAQIPVLNPQDTQAVIDSILASNDPNDIAWYIKKAREKLMELCTTFGQLDYFNQSRFYERPGGM